MAGSIVNQSLLIPVSIGNTFANVDSVDDTNDWHIKRLRKRNWSPSVSQFVRSSVSHWWCKEWTNVLGPLPHRFSVTSLGRLQSTTTLLEECQREVSANNNFDFDYVFIVHFWHNLNTRVHNSMIPAPTMHSWKNPKSKTTPSLSTDQGNCPTGFKLLSLKYVSLTLPRYKKIIRLIRSIKHSLCHVIVILVWLRVLKDKNQ